MEANRIIVNAPQNIFEALEIAQQELSQFSLIQTSLLRYLVPEWGGPEAKPGEQVSYAATEFLRTVPLEKLCDALVVQKTPGTLMDKGFSTKRRSWDFLRNRTRAVGFSHYFDHLCCPS